MVYGQGMGLPSLAERLFRRARAVQSGYRPCLGLSILSEVKPSTGEPCAGDPHARFGGRGSRNQSTIPTFIPGHSRGRAQ